MFTANLLIQTQPGSAKKVVQKLHATAGLLIENCFEDRLTAIWRGRNTQDLVDLIDKLRTFHPEINRIEPTTIESDA